MKQLIAQSKAERWINVPYFTSTFMLLVHNTLTNFSIQSCVNEYIGQSWIELRPLLWAGVPMITKPKMYNRLN